MFSGIVEAVEPLLSIKKLDQAICIQVQRPSHFKDVKIGDSVAVNGTCLTVEALSGTQMTFTIGFESLRVLALSVEDSRFSRPINLERSLRFGDRVHGHFSTGHIDGLGMILAKEKVGESLIFKVQVPSNLGTYFWSKGFITLHGVALTVNAVNELGQLEVCLIPETLKKTNLNTLEPGDHVHVEVDWMAKAFVQAVKSQSISGVHQ